MSLVREKGTKWSSIVKLLPGRSDNAIKNRYYSAVRKALRQVALPPPPCTRPEDTPLTCHRLHIGCPTTSLDSFPLLSHSHLPFWRPSVRAQVRPSPSPPPG